MKLTIPASELAAQAAALSRFLPSRPVMPVLAGIRVSATEDALVMSAFDFETAVTLSSPVLAGESGTVLVSGRGLADITAGLRGDVTLSDEGGRLVLTATGGRGSLPLMSLADHPALPTMPPLVATTDADALDAAVHRVGSTAGRDNTLPQFFALQIRTDAEGIHLAGTDRHRMAFETVAADVIADVEMRPNARLVQEAMRGMAGRVALHGNTDVVGIATPDRQVILRQIAEEPPNMAGFRTPPVGLDDLTLDRDELVDAVKAVARLAEPRQPVRLLLDSDQLTASVGSDRGDCARTMPVAWVGEVGRVVGFNPAYLVEALGCFPAGQVRMRVNPVGVRPVYLDADQSGHLHIVQPVRLP